MKVQICCLVVVLFIACIYFSAKRVRTDSHIIFSGLLGVGIFALAWNVITVYSVNHLEDLSFWFNRFAHDLFLGSMILESYLCFVYSLTLMYDEKIEKKLLYIASIPVWAGWVGVVTLPLHYVKTDEGNYSWGMAAYMVHITLAIYMVGILVVLIRHWKEINPKKRYIVMVAFFIQLVIVVFKTCMPILPLSSLVIMLVVFAFFLTIENPDVLLLEKLREEKERADEANEAKSQFLSNMSHEIRTPMNTIIGMTDIALRENLSPEVVEYLNNIKNSGDALLTIINDILDFSKIESGKMEIVEEEYEPLAVFSDVSMIFLNRIGEKQIELLYDIDPAMPKKLYGDSQRVRQIVINLMNNAIKYTESGYVRLKVKTELLDEKNMKLHFSVEDTGQGIKQEDLGKLFVSFQQVDMQNNHKKEGTGLGLAISRRLVDLMHGEIGVTSEYGKGSVFSFSIPQKIVDATPAARLKEEKKKNLVVGYRMENKVQQKQFEKLAAAYHIKCINTETETLYGEGGKLLPEEKMEFLITDDVLLAIREEKLRVRDSDCKICVLKNPMTDSHSDPKFLTVNKPLYSQNFCQLLNGEVQSFVQSSSDAFSFKAPRAQILIVDDNEINLRVSEELLAPTRMQIDVATDGKQALQMVQAKQYDLVFMDHMMPVMDGMEATMEIRKLEGEYYKKLPIIALTANATSEAREQFKQAEMTDFIAKPILQKELADCVKKWLPKELIVFSHGR